MAPKKGISEGQIKSYLNSCLPAGSLGRKGLDLTDIGKVRVPVKFPSKITLPGDREAVIIRLPGHPIHIPLKDIVKTVILEGGTSAAKAIASRSPVDAGLSVLGILGKLAARATPLSKQQMAICRAILLVMQHKEHIALSEKGASVAELTDALAQQGDEVPARIEAELDKLVAAKVVETEESGATVFYKVVP